MNVDIGTEDAQFLSWKYINRIFLAVHSTYLSQRIVLIDFYIYIFP
jgi:hypothetical protein